MTLKGDEPTRGKAPSRRDFLKAQLGMGLMVGLGFGRLPRLISTPLRPAGNAPAQGVIQIFLGGGLSHIDSFDPKPLAPVEVRGDWKAIPTAIDGEFFAEPLARIAGVAKKIAIIRSMTHGEAAHDRGTHSILTGYPPSPALVYPSLGAVIAHELPGLTAMPTYIAVPNANESLLGTGYLSTKYAPFSLGDDPKNSGFRVRDLEAAQGVDRARIDRRKRLLDAIDDPTDPAEAKDAIRAMETFYDQAWRLIDSVEARTAFDIKKEPQKTRDRYGMTLIGQRLLMARRLIAAGARCVTVIDSGYDNHDSLYQNLKAKLADLDRGYAALIEDLDETGMLKTTLVTLTSEFGRTPRLNATGGRDHWPKVQTSLIAGAGVKGGTVVGESDGIGAEPADRPVTPADLAATVFERLGVDPAKRLMTEGGRPVMLVRDGKPITELLA